MKKVLIIGNGTIGSLMADLLHESKHYQVIIADKNPTRRKRPYQQIQLCINNCKEWEKINKIKNLTAVISALPWNCNKIIIDQAKKRQLHYFDLTESEEIKSYAKQQAQKNPLVLLPQCGIAPGLINIITYDLIKKINNPTDIEIRVGALPQKYAPESQLKYAKSWSTEGLVKEYIAPTSLIEQGKAIKKQSLGDYELICINGQKYEAFNTSGGIGSLIENMPKSIRTCNYKTLRYIGHLQAIKFLMHELNMKKTPETLCQLLNKTLPKTQKDQVVCHIAIHKKSAQQTMTHSWTKVFYPEKRFNQTWSAIQTTTALGACAMIDCILQDTTQYQGFIDHKQIPFDEIKNNQFGKQLL